MLIGEAKEQNNKLPDNKGAEPICSFYGSVVGPGRQIGPFRIEQELGRGTAGVVYLAHDTKLNRSLVIKSLPAGFRWWYSRRSIIESVIGQCKLDNRLDRNYLKGIEGDEVNAKLSACWFNIRKLLRKILFWAYTNLSKSAFARRKRHTSIVRLSWKTYFFRAD